MVSFQVFLKLSKCKNLLLGMKCIFYTIKYFILNYCNMFITKNVNSICTLKLFLYLIYIKFFLAIFVNLKVIKYSTYFKQFNITQILVILASIDPVKHHVQYCSLLYITQTQSTKVFQLPQITSALIRFKWRN